MVPRKIDGLSSSLEDYLETIYKLEQENRVARSKDVAKALGVGKSSVTAALKTLTERGFIDYSPYQHIVLTDAGQQAARDVLRRHEVLQEFLEEILAVPTELATSSACKLEHAIEGEVLERLLLFVDFFSACPRGQSLLAEFKRVCNEGLDPSRCKACVMEGFEQLKEEEKPEQTNLAALQPGERGIVLRIKGDKRFHKRIVDMGVTKGAVVSVERVAPMGDPMQVKVRGYHLSIRRVDAASIIIEHFKDRTR